MWPKPYVGKDQSENGILSLVNPSSAFEIRNMFRGLKDLHPVMGLGWGLPVACRQVGVLDANPGSCIHDERNSSIAMLPPRDREYIDGSQFKSTEWWLESYRDDFDVHGQSLSK